MLDKKGEWPVKQYEFKNDLTTGNGQEQPIMALTSQGEVAQVDVPPIISEVFDFLTEEQINYFWANYIFNEPKQKISDAFGNDTGKKIAEVRKKIKQNLDGDITLTKEEASLLLFGFKNYLLKNGIQLPDEIFE